MTMQFGTQGLTNALVPLPKTADARPTASPNPRVPCVVVRDGTASMAGPKIDQLNAGMRELARFVRSDKLVAADAELASVAVAGVAKVEVPFAPAGSFDPPPLEPHGTTPLGDGLLTGLQLLSDRLALYRELDLDHHVPWLLLVTDGEENDDPERFAAAGRAIRQLEKANRLRFFAVGVDGANMAALQSLTIYKPYALRGLDFKALFAWLYRSLRTVSQSQPGEDVRPEDPTGPRGFAE
jgi:uncharacterized protein YegL